MNRVIVAAALLATGAALWPEAARYRAEWSLADANARLSAALHGRGSAASVEKALSEARDAITALPGDPRAPLATAIALLLLQRGDEAKTTLERAIASSGERPELTLNLGRARGTLGDEAGAQAAFLRTAWASPAAISTLPSPLRAAVLERVRTLEDALHDGRLEHAPPLD
ncbi:MAG TPA: hypothetical protein VFS55_13350 [Dokdonella sp.]|nr:hypothetical protein [Dokdonella sp.]